MRKKKAIINIFFSLLLELITAISGFIVPRMIISNYGSITNGLINSVSSFIGYISILQLGVGSVIKASLYKPLAKKEYDRVNVIVKTASNFFKKIGFITIIYVIILMFVFPLFISKQFDFFYTSLLIIIIGVSTIFTYLFGITYHMLIEADQKSYIFSIIQIITVILNTAIIVILINLNFSILFVKGISAIVYILRPIILNLYVRKKYKINNKVCSDEKVISQRWDGFAQGLAYYIHSKTDIFVLSIFSSLENVSIYSIYALVTNGLNMVLSSIDKAVRSVFGSIIAKNENAHLRNIFDAYNLVYQIICTILFSTACITIFSFISIYIGNKNDIDYINYTFGLIILSAEYVYCLRMPYNSIIFAAGKFKETKKSAFVEALLNIFISVILVYHFGLVGIALGTLIAMIYRTVNFIVFLHKNILMIQYDNQIKRFCIDTIAYLLGIFVISMFNFNITNFIEWFIYLFVVLLIDSIVVFSINFILYKKNVIKSIALLLNKKKE